MPRRSPFVVSLCALLALGGVASPAVGDDLEDKRDGARRRAGEVRGEIEGAEDSAAELDGRLTQIDRDLTRRRAEAEDARRDSQAAKADVIRLKTEIERLRKRLEDRKAIFNRRAATAYMGGEGRPLDELSMAGELFSLPEDFTEAARRQELVARVSAQDEAMLDQLAETRHDLSRQEVSLVISRDRAATRASDAARAVAAVADLKKDQQATRAALTDRIAELNAEADALAAEQTRLEALIRERIAAAAARARASRGGLFAGRATTHLGVSNQGFIWPIQGVVTSRFGWRWGRQHTGIDIAAPGGTPIGASKTGVVIYAGWMGGYGNLVVLDHGDSVVTLYAHQSRMAAAEGQLVEQGQVLGFVGTTGHSTGNHLHFEVRIDAEPVDPFPYLP